MLQTVKQILGSASRSRAINRFELFIKILFAYLAFVGLGSFPLFIAEEQSQILCWSNFPAMSERRYDLVQMNLDSLGETVRFMRAVNKYWMWMCPPQKRSYEIYADGLDGYIKTHESIILGSSPELYLDRTVSVKFRAQSQKPVQDGVLLKNNKFNVIINKNFNLKSEYLDVSGKIQNIDGIGTVIDMR